MRSAFVKALKFLPVAAILMLVIVAATTPKQRVVVSTLEKLPADASAQNLEPPAIVVIGEIVKLRDALATTTAIPEESK